MKRNVSVIVPIYNVEKYLRKCVSSILEQSYKNIEIILVDDGSTDMSGKICDELSKEHDNVIVIHKQNGGLSSARNAGIEASNGDYLSFIDSDDYIEKTMYEEMVNAIENSKKDIASCGRIVDVYGSHENKEFCLDNVAVYSREESMREVLHFSSVDVSACDKLYKKHLFDKIRYPEGKISEDAAVVFELIEKSNGIVHVGKPFYHYVFRKKSISKSKYSEKNFDVLNNLRNTKTFIKDNFPDLIDDFKIYSCITAAAQILLLNQDKIAIKKYKNHYNEFFNFFIEGYEYTIKLPETSKKDKLKYFCIKHKIIWFYNLTKKMYQIKYSFKLGEN